MSYDALERTLVGMATNKPLTQERIEEHFTSPTARGNVYAVLDRLVQKGTLKVNNQGVYKLHIKVNPAHVVNKETRQKRINAVNTLRTLRGIVTDDMRTDINYVLTLLTRKRLGGDNDENVNKD